MSRKTEVLKYIGKASLLLMAGILLGTVLMIGVYALPTLPMRENVARSSAIFDYEGVYPQLVQGYKSSQLDNCTDAIMLGTAIYSETDNGIIEKALRNKRVEYTGDSPVQSVNDYANDVEGMEELEYTVEYPRYWHGYLLVLKPLLLFFDFGDIRYLNMIAQVLLAGWLGALLYEKGRFRLLLPFGLLVLVLNPAAVMLSFQFSSVYYIMLAVSAVLLLNDKKKWLQNEGLLLFFMGIGILTSFFDFLTYPVITLGVPLAIAVLCNHTIQLRKMVGVILSWGSGYAGMWMGKWLVSSILLKGNMISDAVNQLKVRSSMELEGQELSWAEVLWKNVRVTMKWPYILLGAILLLWGIYAVRRYGIEKRGQGVLGISIRMLLVSGLPLGWYLIAGNHSYEHYWFTYRALGVSFFALAAWWMQLPGMGKSRKANYRAK